MKPNLREQANKPYQPIRKCVKCGEGITQDEAIIYVGQCMYCFYGLR